MLNEKLREIRENKGYKQKDLANFLKVSVGLVSDWEDGVSEPPVLRLPAIAKFYGCKIDEFFEEEMGKTKEELEERLEELEERLDELQTEETDIEDEIYEIERKLQRYAQVEKKEEKPLTAKLVKFETEIFEAFCELAKDGITQNGKEIEEFLGLNQGLKDNLAVVFAIIETSGSVSISLLQRKLSIGYNMAGRLVDGLEKIGVITGFDGARPRDIKQDNLKAFKEYLGIE